MERVTDNQFTRQAMGDRASQPVVLGSGVRFPTFKTAAGQNVYQRLPDGTAIAGRVPNSLDGCPPVLHHQRCRRFANRRLRRIVLLVDRRARQPPPRHQRTRLFRQRSVINANLGSRSPIAIRHPLSSIFHLTGAAWSGHR